MLFVGRENELKSLGKLYDENGFQMVVVYGRRRIGKTALISKFISDKPAIFFTAQELNDVLNLREFSKKIYNFFQMPETVGAFDSWISAFEFLAEKAKQQRFILVIDEFPYAAYANRSLKSILQTAIDHSFKNTGLFLMLCGSHMGFMENEVLGYKSPLFGRRTAQIKLDGFDYYDAGKMLNSFSNEDKLKIYACVGGTPHYLAQVKGDESFEENIKRLYFESSGYLYNEPMMLLQQELREPAIYNAITQAIAGGASRLNEISTKIGEDSPKVSKYLQTLVNLQIVRKVYPFGENPQNSRKGIYQINDNCYNFWYRFVFNNKPEIESGNGDIIADTEVFGKELSAYIGKIPFENICLQYLQRTNKSRKLPFVATTFGSWWGNDPVSRSQTDFDVIAANRNSNQIILGECKWKFDMSLVKVFENLVKKEHLLPEYKDRHYYIFTRTELKQKQEISKFTAVDTNLLFEE
jgi:AAA+ ATPase superfamily predicted ATPase